MYQKIRPSFLGLALRGVADSNDGKMRFPAGRLYSRFVWEFKHVQTTEGSFGSNLEALEELFKYFIISGVQPFINQPFGVFLVRFHRRKSITQRCFSRLSCSSGSQRPSQ